MHRSLRQAGVPLLLMLLVMASTPAGVDAGRPPGDGMGASERPAAPKSPAGEAKPARPAKGYEYTVQAGDTYWDIAAAHSLSVDELLAANGATGKELLKPGDKLFVPAERAIVPRPKPPPTPTAAPPPTAQPAPPASTAAPPAPPHPEAATPGPTPAPSGGPPPPPPPATVPPAPQQPEWADALLKLINAKRIPAGLPELVWSDDLAAAARAHAEDCARRNWGSHVGSDGAALRARLARAGYAAAAASENWANAQTAPAALAMWWNEPATTGPHRRNILDPRWRELGIGIVRGAWGWYFVADFGAR